MKIPKFDYECYIITIVESKTGKLLNMDVTYYESKGDNYFVIKDSMIEVKLFIENNLNEDVDISVYDNNGVFLDYHTVLNDGKG